MPSHRAIPAGMPNSTMTLSPPPITASHTASKNRYCISRHRLAPTASRIDSSRSRAAPRTDEHHAGNVHARDQQRRGGQAHNEPKRASHLPPVGGALREVYRLDGSRFEFVRRRVPPGYVAHRQPKQSHWLARCRRRVGPTVDVHPVDRSVGTQVRIGAEARMPLERHEQLELEALSLKALKWPRNSCGATPTTMGDPSSVRVFPTMPDPTQPVPPETMAHDDAGFGHGRSSPPGRILSAGQRHAETDEIIRRHEERGHPHWSLSRFLAACPGRGMPVRWSPSSNP